MKQNIWEKTELDQYCAAQKDFFPAGSYNAAALLEIDRFSKIRSLVGYEKAEAIYRKTGECLLPFISDNVWISRFADGIYRIVFRGLKSREEMTDLCEKLRNAASWITESGRKITSGICAVRFVQRNLSQACDRALRGLEETAGEPGRIVYCDEPEHGEKVRVMVVEDQELPRQVFESHIRQSGRYELAYSLRNADAAYFYAAQGNVDLILMDVVTDRGASGLEASARIKKAFPKIKIIIVTSMPEVTYLDRARQAGVDSFWYKEENETPILEVMDRTMSGDSIYPDTTPEVQLGTASSYELTDRELSILRELMSGSSNQEIGKKLYLSPATVKYHIANMLMKTGYRSRTELAVRARESGLIIPDRTDES
ncbi:MAG: response regulator transcription factor [Erysipelotrichales bacterium]|nr:response regulator transcription factor [Erysipelotrichales bacterium]